MREQTLENKKEEKVKKEKTREEWKWELRTTRENIENMKGVKAGGNIVNKIKPETKIISRTIYF